MVLAGGKIMPFNFTGFNDPSNTVGSPGGGYPSNGGGVTVGNTPSATARQNYTPPASYLVILFVIIGGLVLAKYFAEHGEGKSSYHLVGINVQNTAALTIMVGLGITVAKIIANKWPIVPAVTDIVNMW